MRAFASLPAILIGLAACATANGPAPAGTETVRVSGAGGVMTAEIHPSDALRGGDVAVPIDRAWAVVRAVYDSLHLPVASFDPSSHTIESPMLRVRRRLGDTPLSKYLNCGDTQGGQSADSYEIQLLVRTSLRMHQDTTSILTNVSAEGRPITLSGDYTRCISTGYLENRVVVLTTSLAVR